MGEDSAPNCVVLLGPTAAGKTAIGARIAAAKNGEIISADSRQVYRGLDIGSGKDLGEYNVGGASVPYHLIDVTDLSREYSAFDFQNDFYDAFALITGRGKLPVVVGGSGMYLDAIIRHYDLTQTPRDDSSHEELERKSLEELAALLVSLKGDIHGGEDARDKERCIKAIEIASFARSAEGRKARERAASRRRAVPLVIGTTLEREVLRARISARLDERLRGGMVEEVAALHQSGVAWSRLENLGLEYKFVSQFLEGKITTKEELREKLNIAIRQFAKRQETWFRGMERKGVEIHWLPKVEGKEERARAAIKIIEEYF